MLETIIQHIIGEWRVIARAPGSFVVAVLAVGFCIWLAMESGK
jgi:hypothetical protein